MAMPDNGNPSKQSGRTKQMATQSADTSTTEPNPVDLLTEKEVAAILRVSVSTLRRWRGVELQFPKIGSAVR